MDILHLPAEIDYIIASNLDYWQLLEFCAVNRRFARIYSEPWFWELKTIHDFEISSPKLKKIYLTLRDTILPEREAYFKLAGDREWPIPGAEKYGDPNKLVEAATERFFQLKLTNTNLIERFFKVNKDTCIFRTIGYNGRIDVIEKFIDKYRESKIHILNSSLLGAASVGKTDLVVQLLDQGATNYFGAFNLSIYSRNYETIQYLLDKPGINLNSALGMAGEIGDLNMINFLIAQGATNYKNALGGAAAGGHYGIVDVMVNLGADDFDVALARAAGTGNIDMMEYLINKGATDLNQALSFAASKGQLPAVRFLIEKGATDFNEALKYAPCTDNLPMVEFLISLGASNFHSALKIAAESGSIKIFQHLFKYATEENIRKYLQLAKQYYHTNIIEFITEF